MFKTVEYMHIAENMFVSKILLSGGDQLQGLPLAPHLHMGVEVNIESPPPPSPPLSNFIIICISLLAI